MQTFLPYPDFRESAKVLDWKRLGKQRVEALQIYRAITGEALGWKNHPAVLMWQGFPDALAHYFNVVCMRWEIRRFENNLPRLPVASAYKMPPWIGDAEFHRSHRSNLLRKDWEHYSQYFQDRTDLPYI